MKRAFVLILISLASCSTAGPSKIGKDMYSISVRAPLSGPAGAKAEALQEANEYCKSLNKQVLLKRLDSFWCGLPGVCGEAQAMFLCLDENDPRYLANDPKR